MRKIIVIVMAAALVAACQRTEPDGPNMFSHYAGLLSASDVSYLRSQTADFSAKDVSYYNDPARKRERYEIQKQLLDSRECLAKFRIATAGQDARASFLRGDRRLFAAVRNGIAAGIFVPGGNACGIADDNAHTRPLNNPMFGCDVPFPVVGECDERMIAYAAAYNDAMAVLAPETRHLACTSKAIAQVPPAPPREPAPARPRGNPGSWVTPNDYPREARAAAVEGAVGFRVVVAEDGRVEACSVTWSSGNAALDEATCANVGKRARFTPAQDADGRPIKGSWSNRARWTLPAKAS